MRKNATVRVLADGKEVFSKQYKQLRPPEMERIKVSLGEGLNSGGEIVMVMETAGAVGK